MFVYVEHFQFGLAYPCSDSLLMLALYFPKRFRLSYKYLSGTNTLAYCVGRAPVTNKDRLKQDEETTEHERSAYLIQDTTMPGGQHDQVSAK